MELDKKLSENDFDALISKAIEFDTGRSLEETRHAMIGMGLTESQADGIINNHSFSKEVSSNQLLPFDTSKQYSDDSLGLQIEEKEIVSNLRFIAKSVLSNKESLEMELNSEV